MKTPPLIPGWLLIATIAAFGLAMCVTMQGCATMDYRWTKDRPDSLKPWLYVTVSDIDRTCREEGAQVARGARINACASWRPVGCVIYVPPDVPAWILAHEERHCLGWVHQ